MRSLAIEQSFIDVAGCRSPVLRAGDGPSVVLIPSMMVLGRSYRETMLELAKRGFAVTIVEAPGSGGASHLSRGWSFEQYGLWCAQLLDELDVHDATLIAHSNSGPLTMIAATSAPHRVARLLLADSVGADERHSLLRILGGRAVDAVLEPILSLRRWHHVIINALRHTRNFWHQVKACAAFDALGIAADVRQPTLLAWGWWDHTTPRRCLRAFQKVMPNASTYFAETGSHDWLITRPAEFAQAVAEFARRANFVQPASAISHR